MPWPLPLRVVEPFVSVEGAREGMAVECYFGAFGQFEQELADPSSGVHRFDPTALVIALPTAVYTMFGGVQAVTWTDETVIARFRSASVIATRRAICFASAIDSARTGSGHHLVMDDAGGDAGMRPAELVPTALAGCTAMDVISILSKKRQKVTGFGVAVIIGLPLLLSLVLASASSLSVPLIIESFSISKIERDAQV